MGFAPLTITGRLVIDPDPANRSYCLSVVGEGYGTSSCRSLDLQSPKTTFFTFKSLPEGDYEVRGVVERNDGESRSATPVKVEVQGRE